MAQTGTDQDQLQKDIAALRKDLGSLTETVREMMNGALQGAGQRVGAAAKAVKAQGEASAAALENQVQTHPFTALAIAFGIGYLVSRMTVRRD